MSGEREKEQVRQYDLDEPFVWQNTASYDNIPDYVRPIVDEVIDAVRTVYDEELEGALYLQGSCVAGGGGFVKDASDIDAVYISSKPIPPDHKLKRAELLKKIDIEGLVGYLDVIAMEESEASSPSRKGTIFSCYLNGMQVAGSKNYDLAPYVPKTKGDYFLSQYMYFGQGLMEALRNFDKNDKQKDSPINFAKRVMRAWFYVAYLRGCPYEQNVQKMEEVLARNSFDEELAKFKYFKSLREKEVLSDDEKREVLQSGEQLWQIIEPIIAEYQSEYGDWVRGV